MTLKIYFDLYVGCPLYKGAFFEQDLINLIFITVVFGKCLPVCISFTHFIRLSSEKIRLTAHHF